MIRSTTLRPGLLVSLKTSISGNVDYTKTVIEEEYTNAAGQLIGSWQTDKIVFDAAEQEAAIKVRSKARSLLTSVCARSDFGLLCPESKQGDLEAAIKAARDLCDTFNMTAKLTTISFYTITGRIAADDVEAVRAINSEVRSLLDDMQQGITKLDVEAVRAAAAKAKQLGSMLSPEAQERIQGAIDAVRATAKKMIKAGDQAATEIDAATLAKLAEARTAFLDLDGATELVHPDAEARAIDLDPSVIVVAPAAPVAPDLDLEAMLG